MSNVHSQQLVADGIHGVVAYEPADATALAAITPSSTNKYKQACRQDDGSLWIVLPTAGAGSYYWAKISTASSFSGDFAALAATYSLNVRLFARGDLGVTGTTGTGKSSWANQSGDGSAITFGSGATNGIGSVGALNGKATVLGNGATQFGGYTFPSGPLPGTTNRHLYLVQRIVANPGASQGYMHFGTGFGANQYLNCFADQTSPAADIVLGNVSPGAQTSGVIINQWYRGKVSFIGGADVIRWGAHAPTAVTTGNYQIGNAWSFNHNGSGSAIIGTETALIMHLEGTLANYNLFTAAADPLLATFWSGATAIEI